MKTRAFVVYDDFISHCQFDLVNSPISGQHGHRTCAVATIIGFTKIKLSADSTMDSITGSTADSTADGRIRKYLNQSAAEHIIHAFVTSRLDNGNALFYGLLQNQKYLVFSTYKTQQLLL